MHAVVKTTYAAPGAEQERQEKKAVRATQSASRYLCSAVPLPSPVLVLTVTPIHVLYQVTNLARELGMAMGGEWRNMGGAAGALKVLLRVTRAGDVN